MCLSKSRPQFSVLCLGLNEFEKFQKRCFEEADLNCPLERRGAHLILKSFLDFEFIQNVQESKSGGASSMFNDLLDCEYV